MNPFDKVARIVEITAKATVSTMEVTTDCFKFSQELAVDLTQELGSSVLAHVAIAERERIHAAAARARAAQAAQKEAWVAFRAAWKRAFRIAEDEAEYDKKIKVVEG